MEEQQLQAGLRSFCRQQFPGRGAMTVTDLTEINDGWECEVYSFRLGWQKNQQPVNQDLILRMYDLGNGEQLIPDKHTREFATMRQLHLSGYPVPQVLAVDGGGWLGKPAIIMEKIAGIPLWQALIKSAEESRPAILQTFTALFRRLHQLDWRPFLPIVQTDLAEGPIQHTILVVQDYLQRVRTAEFGPAMEWLTKRATEVSPAGNSLVHWDYHPDNVLMRASDQQPFVIDWTTADITDYRFDLAWSRLLMGDQWGELMLAEYQRQAGQTIADFDFFLAFACMRRLFVMSTAIRQGASRLGMRAGAEVNIRRGYKHLQDVYQELRSLTGIQLPGVETLIAELQP